MKNNHISLILHGNSTYTIFNNTLKRKDGSNFNAFFYKDKVLVDPAICKFDQIVIGTEKSETKQNKSSGVNKVNINGIEVTSSGDTLSINTTKKNFSVFVNGVMYAPASSEEIIKITKDDVQDDLHNFVYNFKEIDFIVADISCTSIFNKDICSLEISDSELTVGNVGNFSCTNYGGQVNIFGLKIDYMLSLNILGHGDIDVSDIIADNIQIQSMSNGDIYFKNSEAKTVSINIMGNGCVDINGLKHQNLNKIVLGNGDVMQ
jgi:hypothetical protein